MDSDKQDRCMHGAFHPRNCEFCRFTWFRIGNSAFKAWLERRVAAGLPAGGLTLENFHQDIFNTNPTKPRKGRGSRQVSMPAVRLRTPTRTVPKERPPPRDSPATPQVVLPPRFVEEERKQRRGKRTGYVSPWGPEALPFVTIARKRFDANKEDELARIAPGTVRVHISGMFSEKLARSVFACGVRDVRIQCSALAVALRAPWLEALFRRFDARLYVVGRESEPIRLVPYASHLPVPNLPFSGDRGRSKEKALVNWDTAGVPYHRLREAQTEPSSHQPVETIPTDARYVHVDGVPTSIAILDVLNRCRSLKEVRVEPIAFDRLDRLPMLGRQLAQRNVRLVKGFVVERVAASVDADAPEKPPPEPKPEKPEPEPTPVEENGHTPVPEEPTPPDDKSHVWREILDDIKRRKERERQERPGLPLPVPPPDEPPRREEPPRAPDGDTDYDVREYVVVNPTRREGFDALCAQTRIVRVEGPLLEWAATRINRAAPHALRVLVAGGVRVPKGAHRVLGDKIVIEG